MGDVLENIDKIYFCVFKIFNILKTKQSLIIVVINNEI